MELQLFQNYSQTVPALFVSTLQCRSLRYNSNVGLIGDVVEANNCAEKSRTKMTVETWARDARMAHIPARPKPRSIPQLFPKDQVCGGYDHRTGRSYGAAVRSLQGFAIAFAAKEFDMISRHGWLTSLSIERLWPTWLLRDLAMRVRECSNHILEVWSNCQSHVSKVYWIMCAYTRCFGADACHVNVSEMNYF